MRSLSSNTRVSAVVFLLGLLSMPGCSDDSAATDSGVDRGAHDSVAADKSASDSSASDISASDAAGDATSDARVADAKAVDTLAADSLSVDTLAPDLPTGGCNALKIGFTRANTQKYELYEFCFAAGDTVTEALVKALDSSLLCIHSSGGAFAMCPTGKWRCSGTLTGDASGTILQADWDKVCLLSQLPKVGKIAGGHYL